MKDAAVHAWCKAGLWNALLVSLVAAGGCGVAAASGAIENEIVNARDGSRLVLIPAGEFRMGSPEGAWGPELDEAGDDEKPLHTVFIGAFYMGKYEVTDAQYARFSRETGRPLHETPSLSGPDHPNPLKSQTDGPSLPAVNVSWNDAEAYCSWAGLRLPTEAEWEKAARGGADTRFWWGDEATHERANYDSTGMTTVGSYPGNTYGVHDTAGNVWEWCADWYDDKYYANSPANNPQGPPTGTTRVHRGGSWSNYPYYIRPAIRYCSAPDRWSKLMGFRCARAR